MEKITRRDFLRKAAVATAGAAVAVSIPSIVEAAMTGYNASAAPARVTLKKNSVILFQGDSITDNGRRRNDMAPNSAPALGFGYAAHAAAVTLLANPGLTPQIYNKGISGNKVFELRNRWEEDCFALKPDVLSMLIGVNDFWHSLSFNYDGTPEVYLRDYMDLMDQTKQRLPDVQLVICEPFAVKGVKAVTDEWFPTFDKYRAYAKQVADKYDAIFIPFQSIFDEAQKSAPASYWTYDGVHPSPAGDGLMAAAWIRATGLMG